MMRYKAILALSAVSVLLINTGAVNAASPLTTKSFSLFAPLAAPARGAAWILSDQPLVRLAQGRDVFPPVGFDPSLPDNQQKPERAPVWPVSPTEPEAAKPFKIEPMKLLQAPKLIPAPPKPAPQAFPRANGAAAPVRRPIYRAPQPGAAYGYGYPQPPGYNPALAGRNPWAPNNRNSWTKAGRNSWNNPAGNSWSKTGRNTVTDSRGRNPWATPGSAARRPQGTWGANPYYGQRQPVFAPRYGNPWQAEVKPSAGSYASGFPPLYRRADSNTKAKTGAVYAPGVYPNYNFAPPAPWYGAAPGIR